MIQLPSIHGLSLKEKLTLTNVLTSLLAIVLAAGAFVIHDYCTTKDQMVRHLEMVAKTIDQNSTEALYLADTNLAKQALQILIAEPDIVSGRIHSAGGEILADFRRPREGGALPSCHPSSWPPEGGVRFQDGVASICRPLSFPEGRPGAIVLQADMTGLRERQRRYLLIVAGVMGGCTLCVIIMAAMVQKIIARPLLDLVALARTVAETKDYSLRAKVSGSDELGALTQVFNGMLAQIQGDDEKLKEHKANLEEEVAKRTQELLRVNAELKASRDLSEAANRAKSDFLAHMSHEIRTPINGMMGMVDLLLKTSLNSKQSHYAKIAKSSADLLLSLINDILDFSKIEAGKMEIEQSAFNLHRVVEDVIETFSKHAEKKGLELLHFVSNEVPEFVRGDQVRLRQVLTNLLSNAMKFTQVGEVFVQVCPVPRRDGQLMVCFDVRDTGIGIPGDRVDKIFDAFAQLDASTTRKYGGTGLGLAICKSLVQLMGGEISASSEVGRGSTFSFTVALQRHEGSIRTRTRPSMMCNLSGRRALVVGGHASQRAILCRQLLEWKLEAEGAAGAQEALGKLRSAAEGNKAFAYVILDRRLPESDGLDLARTIKGMPELSNPSIVLCASIEDPVEEPVLREAGIFAQLEKPVRQSALFNSIVETVVATGGPKAPAGAKQGAAQPVVGGARRTAKILLVEDNEINQFLAVEVLTIAGYTCDTVVNGKLAVDAVLARPYDLVLMDCHMPEMDGLEATRKIREAEKEHRLPHHPSGALPIVALTANAIKGERERCIDAGMDEYLVKPLDPDRLISTIRRFTEDQGAGLQGPLAQGAR